MRPDAPDMGAVLAIAEGILGADVAVERVTEGVSTFVYRAARRGETFYLRILPEPDASFAPEVWVHEALRAHGVPVPEVVAFEHRHPALGLSLMVAREIPGCHVGCRPPDGQTPVVLREAGRSLAVINSIPVDGFGWIRRDRQVITALEAEHPTQRAFVQDHLDADLVHLERHDIPGVEAAAVRVVLDRYPDWLAAERASLAHGDFDVTQIFQQGGRFTGIIDFGEIRGTDRWYDLGHFRMHDGETNPAPLLDWLVEGYREVTPLSDEFGARICFASLLIALRALGRRLEQGRRDALYRQAITALRRELALVHL